MGRPKNYVREDVLAEAMSLFWERGFHATSTRDLAQAMGLNPYSLFAEFGSKDGLFDAAVDRYMDTVVTGHFGRLETADAGLADVRAVLDWFGRNGTRDEDGLGCLMGNTITERAPTVARSREHAGRFVARVRQAFAHALQRAVTREELVRAAPVDALAAGITTHLIGVFAMSRARIDSSVIRHATDQQLALLDAYVPPAPGAS